MFIICCISLDSVGVSLKYAFVHYGFQNEQHPIIHAPHRKSKGTTPYKRTKPTTIQRLKEVCHDGKEKNPKQILEIVDSEMGGIEATSSSSYLPRNKQQVRNVKRTLFASTKSDEFSALLARCKIDTEGFVRCIQAAPEPACVLATDSQLDQLVINCTGEHYSVATIDPTFNLGDFYVTPIVFKSKKFVRKHSEDHPICMGPILIHHRMNYASYSYFANQLVNLRPSLRGMKAIGTDGEQPLFTAMCDTFRSTVHLRCFRHFKENIISKLKDLHIAECAQQEILQDIFGTVCGSQHQLGLVDSNDEDDFDENLAKAQIRWNSLEMCNRRMLLTEEHQPQFHAWFEKYKSAEMKCTMLKSVREKAGLAVGDTVSPFYTNSRESLNRMLKEKVNHSKSGLNDFVDHMMEFVKQQDNEMKRAVCRVGDLRLHSSYSHLEKSEEEWLQMDVQSRQSHFTTLMKLPLEPNGTGQTDSNHTLSKDYSPLLDKGIHETTLRNIWKKAAELANTDGMIVPIPGEKACLDRMVASRSGQTPHTVRAIKKGVLKCDGQCQMYTTHKLCAHVIAVAEVHGKLEELIQYLVTGNMDPNISSMVMIGMPHTSGKKPGQKPGAKRRRSKKQDAPKVTSKVSRFAGTNATSSLPSCTASLTATHSSATFSPAVEGALPYNPPSPAYPSYSPYPSYPPYPPLPFNPANPYYGAHHSTHDYSYPHLPFPSQPTPYSHASTTTGGVGPYSLSYAQSALSGGPTPNYGTPGYYGSNSTPMSHSTPSVYSQHPFTGKFITGRISKCQGCGNKFRAVNPEIRPPFDLIVSRLECRPYFCKQKQEVTTPKTPSNSHYHADFSCIRSADPTFQSTQLVIPPEVQSKLLPVHKEHLRWQFGLRFT